MYMLGGWKATTADELKSKVALEKRSAIISTLSLKFVSNIISLQYIHDVQVWALYFIRITNIHKALKMKMFDAKHITLLLLTFHNENDENGF